MVVPTAWAVISFFTIVAPRMAPTSFRLAKRGSGRQTFDFSIERMDFRTKEASCGGGSHPCGGAVWWISGLTGELPALGGCAAVLLPPQRRRGTL
mgnify:CR=1 FL=1